MIGGSIESGRKGVKFEEMPDNLVSNEESKKQLSPLAVPKSSSSKKKSSVSEFSERASNKRATVDPEQMFEGG